MRHIVLWRCDDCRLELKTIDKVVEHHCEDRKGFRLRRFLGFDSKGHLMEIRAIPRCDEEKETSKVG